MGRRAHHGRPHARPHEGVRPIISPFDPAHRAFTRNVIDRDAAGRGVAPENASTLEARIEAALDRVRPAIRRDSGDVWLVKVEGDIAYVQMIGACGGCPASNATLKGGIEAVIREDVPEIRTVEQV
jgi:Fe-S cluster biogenesis protein NfuA